MNTLETGTSYNASDSEVWSRSWTHLGVNRRSPASNLQTYLRSGRKGCAYLSGPDR